MKRYQKAVQAIGGHLYLYGLPAGIRAALKIARTPEKKADILESYIKEIPALYRKLWTAGDAGDGFVKLWSCEDRGNAATGEAGHKHNRRKDNMKKANGTRAEKKTTLRKAGKASRQARRATAYTLPNGTRAEIRGTKYFIDGRKVKKIEFQTAVYAGFGIKTVITGKNADVIHLVCEPLNTEVVPVLKNGNTKIGRGVWQFSITAGNAPLSREVVAEIIRGIVDRFNAGGLEKLRADCGGTCGMNCPHCYAQVGHYTHSNVQICLGRHTYLARYALDWLRRAIAAQVIADNIAMCRIHVAGDFFGRAYAEMWLDIIRMYPETIFWTYTKQTGRGGLDDVLQEIANAANANIVDSIVTVGGKSFMNFGTAAEVMKLYHLLKSAGESVYICKCGLDASGVDAVAHCNRCNHCFTCKFVLFLKHSDDTYNAAADPDFPAFCELVRSQND